MKQHSGHDRALEDARRLDHRFRRGMVVSIGLHALLLVAAVAMPGVFPPSGESLWGSPDASGGIRIGITGEMGGIALPRPDVVNETAAGNDSEGFFESEPPPPSAPEEAPEPAAEAEPIPDNPVPVEAAPPPPPPDPPEEAPEPEAPLAPRPPDPAPPPRETSTREPPPDRPDNAVPFGEGGQVALPFGQSGSGDGTGLSVGDGAFGDRYGTYVEGLRTRIANQWLQGMINATVRSAPRVYVAFDIERDGRITNIRVEQSSGNVQVDRSARRAVQVSSPVQPLPRDFRGARVSVRFWFDLRR